MQGIHTDAKQYRCHHFTSDYELWRSQKYISNTKKKKSKPRLTKLDSINQQKTLF